MLKRRIWNWEWFRTFVAQYITFVTHNCICIAWVCMMSLHVILIVLDSMRSYGRRKTIRWTRVGNNNLCGKQPTREKWGVTDGQLWIEKQKDQRIILVYMPFNYFSSIGALRFIVSNYYILHYLATYEAFDKYINE